MIATHETPTADYPSEIPLSRIVEVAKLAKISDAHLPIFSEDLLLLLAKVSYDYKTRDQRLALEQKIEREIASVGKAAGKLAQALTALSGGGRFGLLRRLHGGPLVLQSDEDVLQGMKALDSLTQQIERLRVAAQPPGRDAKGSNSDPLDAFVGDLMQMIVCSGGNASFNKNDGKGAFCRVLQVLAPHLPDGLLPPWVVQPDNFETPHGARAIFDATRCDARMQKRSVTPDLRNLAAVTVGLGPGFTVGQNCDLAIETKPGQEGRALRYGETLAADGISRRLGGIGNERFVYSPTAGRWITALDVGTRIYRDFPLGILGQQAIVAPFDGIVRGIARDGIEVRAGVKLIEIDPRGRGAQWTGIDDRSKAISTATCTAIMALRREGWLSSRRIRSV